MEKISNFILPTHTNTLYKEEASSSIALTKDVAKKINELVDAYNELFEMDLKWKQTQEGIIRKGVVFMKDNVINSLHELLKVYDFETIRGFLIEAYGKDFQIFITPQMFGAVGDGVSNDRIAIENAIASLKPGDVLYFPKGTYLMNGRPVEITTENITFTGEGLIRCDYGFRPKASNFKAIGMRMEGIVYSTESRAFMVDNSTEEGTIPSYIEGFTFKNCHFKNFFYAIYCAGGAYNYDGTEEAVGYPVRDVVIEDCYSSTFDDKNAGHFQCIQVENISYINNRTYGGQNASSYNAIKGNGFIRVIGNYDHNNSYASTEIENGSGKCVIANNTFNSKIWVDDSFDVVVNGNTSDEGILITVGSDNGDANNVIISNNICKNIRCEQFGTYKGGIINNVSISGNTVNGDNNHGIWLNGNAVKRAKVFNNIISGTNTNDISIQRNEQLECIINSNFGNGKTILISGTGGKVYSFDNYFVTVSGTRDSFTVSHLEKSFNGLKVIDTDGVEWRIGVNTSGDVFTTPY